MKILDCLLVAWGRALVPVDVERETDRRQVVQFCIDLIKSVQDKLDPSWIHDWLAWTGTFVECCGLKQEDLEMTRKL